MNIFFTLLMIVTYLSASLHDMEIEGISYSDKACISCHGDNTNDDNNPSFQCLGCHDGIIATDRDINFPGAGGYHAASFDLMNLNDTFKNPSISSIETAGFLQDSHPVSVSYIEGVAALRPKNTPISDWGESATINDLLRDGKVECGSCHNPHDKNGGTYLKHRNENSELCFTCHNK